MQLPRTKEWREARGFSQRELSAEAGVGESTVPRVERGDSVTPPTARKIAQALNVSVSDLLETPPAPLASEPLPLAEAPQARGAEQIGERLQVVLAEKLRQQLDANIKALRTREDEARTTAELYEAERDLYAWWVQCSELLEAVAETVPGATGPVLDKALGEASAAVRAAAPERETLILDESYNPDD